MKIIHVMASGAAGGGASHLLQLLPALQRLGCHIEAIVGDDGPLATQLHERGIEAHRRPLMGSRIDIRLGRDLLREAGRRQAALHLHGSRAASLAGMAARLYSAGAQARRIYHAHGLATAMFSAKDPRFWIRREAERWACRGTAGVISCSAADAGRLAEWAGLGSDRVAAVGNVAKAAEFVVSRKKNHLTPQKTKEKARARLGLPVASPLVVTLSRLVPQKNIQTLLSAVLMLEGVHLALAGDGPERARLLAHPLAETGRLHWLGTLDSGEELLRAADVAALSSRWEGEPVMLLEAMANRVPWIATATEGACQLAAASGAGLLAPLEDAAAFAERIASVLTRPGWAEALAGAGAKFSETRTVLDQAKHVRMLYQRWLTPLRA